MIVGNVERQTTNPLFVQILHSEIDADGIDYLMRAATFLARALEHLKLIN